MNKPTVVCSADIEHLPEVKTTFEDKFTVIDISPELYRIFFKPWHKKLCDCDIPYYQRLGKTKRFGSYKTHTY